MMKKSLFSNSHKPIYAINTNFELLLQFYKKGIFTH